MGCRELQNPNSGQNTMECWDKSCGTCQGDMLGPWCPQAPFEAELSEILLCKNELHETLNNLSHWMKDEQVDRTLVRGKRRERMGGRAGWDGGAGRDLTW